MSSLLSKLLTTQEDVIITMNNGNTFHIHNYTNDNCADVVWIDYSNMFIILSCRLIGGGYKNTIIFTCNISKIEYKSTNIEEILKAQENSRE